MTLRTSLSIVLACSISALGSADDLPGVAAIEKLNGFVGDWHFDGVTLDGVAGIDGGQAFRAVQTVRWIVPNKELGIEWSLRTLSGEGFSSGRSRIRWDDISGAVLNTYAGADGDKSFNGVSTLIGISAGDFDWRGHESAGTGDSLNYETTFALSDNDHWRVDFIPTCADNTVLEPMRFVWVRDNEFKKAIGELASVVGQWSRVFQDERGRTVTGSLDIAWGPGERSILIAHWATLDGNRAFRGAEVVFLDPASGEIRSRFVDAAGTVSIGVWAGEPDSVSFTTVCAYEGTDAMGKQVRSLVEMSLTETTLTQRFAMLEATGDEVSEDAARVYHRE